MMSHFKINPFRCNFMTFHKNFIENGFLSLLLASAPLAPPCISTQEMFAHCRRFSQAAFANKFHQIQMETHHARDDVNAFLVKCALFVHLCSSIVSACFYFRFVLLCCAVLCAVFGFVIFRLCGETVLTLYTQLVKSLTTKIQNVYLFE